jgi:hypothetical protein
MRFKEWLIWIEAIGSAGTTAPLGPKKISDLNNLDVSDMTDKQIRLLMKWHGIWDLYKNTSSETKREKLRIRRANRHQGKKGRQRDPSPEEVVDREQETLWKLGGKRGGKWIKRGPWKHETDS